MFGFPRRYAGFLLLGMANRAYAVCGMRVAATGRCLMRWRRRRKAAKAAIRVKTPTNSWAVHTRIAILIIVFFFMPLSVYGAEQYWVNGGDQQVVAELKRWGVDVGWLIAQNDNREKKPAGSLERSPDSSFGSAAMSSVPEPSTLGLLVLSAGLLLKRRR